MNLSAHAAKVSVLVRGPSLSATMSTYLLRRLLAAPNIEILVETHVTELHGEMQLQALTISSPTRTQQVPAHRLFICIGGSPNTAWSSTTSVALDSRGFLLTGGDLGPEQLSAWPLARQPMHLETNQPGVFAAGDVRANSIKRVASAVGEGAMAVALTHRYLAETFG